MPGDRKGSKPRRGDGYRRYPPRRKVCAFCADKNLAIDYKDPSKLRRFLTDRAKIEPRRKTGTCARHQRKLTEAIKRSRYLAMLPYTGEHIRWSGGVGVRSESERRSRRDDRGPRQPMEPREPQPQAAQQAPEPAPAPEAAPEPVAAANPAGEPAS